MHLTIKYIYYFLLLDQHYSIGQSAIAFHCLRRGANISPAALALWERRKGSVVCVADAAVVMINMQKRMCVSMTLLLLLGECVGPANGPSLLLVVEFQDQVHEHTHERAIARAAHRTHKVCDPNPHLMHAALSGAHRPERNFLLLAADLQHLSISSSQLLGTQCEQVAFVTQFPFVD